MALVLSNRVQETTATTGTGTVTLAGAVSGFQSFAIVGNGNTTYYTITSGTDWEVGIGTYSTTGPTLARTTILSSSAAGAAITLVGTSTVFSSYPAEKVISDGYGLLPVANGGTGQSSYTNGQLLIGNTTGNTLTKATLSPGTNVSITNGAGAITINATDQFVGTVTSVGGTGTVNGITLTGTVTSTGDLTLGGTLSGVSLTTQVSGTLPVANGGTGATTLTANNVLLGNGTSAVQVVAPGTTGNVLTSNGTTWTSATAPSSVVQYPQNSQSANYTLVLGDAGKQIFHPVSDTSVRIYTIPANSSVAFSIGTVVLFTAENGALPVNVAITSDTLVFGSGTTGSLAVAANNTLMCIKVTATKWMANYLYQTGSPATISQAIAVSHAITPFVSAYPWSSSGFGVKYTNPVTLPASSGNSVTFTTAGNAIAVAHATTPRISAYPWSNSGFGTKFANPATLPTGDGNGVDFTTAGDAIAVAHSTTPFVSAYPWSGSGFGTKFANPATLPASGGNSVAFSPADNAIAVAYSTTPFVSAYPWSGSGFGTKFANPATLPAGSGNSVAFSPAGDAIAVAQTTTPFVSAYPWNGSGFGVKFANPATLPAAQGNGVAFSPAGDAIAVAHANSPYITAYPWSGSGFGTKFANPATLPTGDGRGVAFSSLGDAIAVAHNTTPFVTAYPWSGSGFGTKFANPATLPTGTGTGVAFTINP